MITAAFSRVTDRLLAADPGLIRLRNASRSALASTVAGGVGISWALTHHEPLMVAALAVLIGMITPLFLRDPTRRGWFLSLFWVYVSACASFALAATLNAIPVIADAGFLAILFIGILCQACGPRALGSALISVVTYYLGLYLRPPLDHAALMLAMSAVGPLAVILVGQVLIPTRPNAVLRLAIHTVALRAESLLRLRLSAIAGRGKAITEVGRQLSVLNEAALALEAQLSLMAPAHAGLLRERLAELEVAAGLCALDTAAHPHDSVEAFRHAIAALKSASPARAVKTPSSPSSTAIGRPLLVRLQAVRAQLSWRPAVRASTAALLAMLVGHAISPERWYWAVITTFVVFLGTRSRADTIHRGVERMGGTIAGAIVSFLLADALHTMPVALIATMVLCVFGWAYYILTSYSRGVFFITVIVGLVYAELGFAIGPLVEMRIEEVLLGCLISLAVAVVMMPLPASKHIETRLLTVLMNLRDVIRASAAARTTSTAANAVTPATSTTPLPTPRAAMRKLDTSWQELYVALRPFQTQQVFVWNPSYELATGSLLACMHWARALSHLPEHAQGPANIQAPLPLVADDQGAGEREASGYHFGAILTRLDLLIAGYRDAGTMMRHTASGANAAQRVTDTAVQQSLQINRVEPSLVQTLMQMDGALTQLADRLTSPAALRPRLRWPLGARSA